MPEHHFTTDGPDFNPAVSPDKDWSDYGRLKALFTTASDEEMLLYVQTLTRPYDPVVYREMCRRGLIRRWEVLERLAESGVGE